MRKKENTHKNGDNFQSNTSQRKNRIEGDNRIEKDNGIERDYHSHKNLGPSDRQMSSEYSKIYSQYLHFAKKEQDLQIVTSIFSLCTIILEVFVVYFIYRILQLDIPIRKIIFIGSIFFILAIITILVLYQLRIIRKWNKSIDKKDIDQESTLTTSHFTLLKKMEKIRKTIIAVIISCLIFFIIFRRTRIEIPIARLPLGKRRAARIYLGLRFITAVLTLLLMIFEITQINKWSKRINQFHLIKQKIQSEIPQFNELDSLLKNQDNVDNFSNEDNS